MRITSEAQGNADLRCLRARLLPKRGVRCRCTLGYLGFLLAMQFFAFSTTLFAQANNGVIRGTVADPTGAVIPNATVRITTPGEKPPPP